MSPLPRSVACGVTMLLALTALSASARAQSPGQPGTSALTPPVTHQSRDKHWRLDPLFRLDETVDNNPFLLSSSRLASLANPSPSSVTSGRYASMVGASDNITTLRGAMSAQGPALLGHTLSVDAGMRYDYYQRNANRRNISVSAGVMQALGHGAHIALRADFIPKYFFRNYLADAVDANADGIIQTSERVYAAGTYSDKSFVGEYRQRLVASDDGHPFGARLTVQGGYKSREYLAPFATRSYRGPVGSATLVLDLSKPLSLDVDYRRASLSATPGSAVLILNEPDFNLDFNGNGRVTDLRVRSQQRVDFSRNEQELGARLHARPTDAVSATLLFARRTRDFTSKEPYDIYNNTRYDHRNRFGLDVGVRMTSRITVRVGGTTEAQNLSNVLRLTTPLDDITDYTRQTFYLSLSSHL